MGDFIIENITTITSLLFGSGSLYAYWTEKTKREAEAKQASSDALKSMQQAYDIFTKDALEKYSKLELEVTKLENKVSGLTKEIQDEKGKYLKLERAYDKLKLEYNILNNAYKALQKVVDKYNTKEIEKCSKKKK